MSKCQLDLACEHHKADAELSSWLCPGSSIHADHLVVDFSVALVELCISASSKVACKADLNSSCVTLLSLYLAPVHFC